MLTLDRVEELFEEGHDGPAELTEAERATLTVEQAEEYVLQRWIQTVYLTGWRGGVEHAHEHEERMGDLKMQNAIARQRVDITTQQARALEARASELLEDNLDGLVGDPRVVSAIVRAWHAEFGSGPSRFDLTLALAHILRLDLTDRDRAREVESRIHEARQMGAITETFDAVE